MRIEVWTKYDLPIIMVISFVIMIIGVYTHRLWYCFGGVVIYITTLIGTAEIKTNGRWRKKHG